VAINAEHVRERLTAYIYPRRPATDEQEAAFLKAVQVQAEYEERNEALSMPGGVASASNDGVSVTFRSDRVETAEYTVASICPAAYAYLFNAGLIRHTLPVARRL
jgi:hypothetical protein